jgi:hypothetical protein
VTRPVPYVAERPYVARRHPIADTAGIGIYFAALILMARLALFVIHPDQGFLAAAFTASAVYLGHAAGDHAQAALWRRARRNDPPDPRPEED